MGLTQNVQKPKDPVIPSMEAAFLESSLQCGTVKTCKDHLDKQQRREQDFGKAGSASIG